MDESYSRVADLLHRLITHVLPSDTTENAVQNFHSYSLRLLSSRIGASVIQDENMIKTLMQKRIQKRAESENITKHSTNTMMLKLQELMTRLNNNKVMQHKWALYYLFIQLSESRDAKTSSSVSPLESIFKAKEVVKSKRALETSNLTNMNKGMDVEVSGNNKTNLSMNQSKLNTTGNASQLGGGKKEESSQQNINKLVQKISNKGNPSIDLSETEILRDILFSFQGIDSNYISYSKHEDSYVIKPTVSLSDPVKRMVSILCEMGWLFRKVVNFLQDQSDRGLIFQSLSFAIKEELDEYYRLIAILENLRDQEDEQSRSSFLVEEDSSSKSLSLRKLYLWTVEPFERLKWLSVLVDACKNARGCVIISIIHSYAKQGSPSIQTLINRVLSQVLSPLSQFIKEWVYFGELNDPHGEFFVSINPSIKDDKLWFEKYTLDPLLIPGFMDQQLAEKILLSGKSVNFMRRCCNVNNWILEIEFIDIGAAIVSNFNQISKFTKFKDWVNQATSITCQKLLSIIFEKFTLLNHFQSIKKFMLFGQGDFIQYLMDTLNSELQKPANSLYRHNMLSLLETAIRASNAQYVDDNYLQRVDIKLLDSSPGDTGWDIFSLTYRVETPVTTILSDTMMKGYLRIFNFLWRVKRVEHSLSSIWTQHMKSAHLLYKMGEIRSHMHKCNILRHEMIHFVSNLLNYIMIEVIEGAWTNFSQSLQKAKDLNEVINEHQDFVNQILDRALLTPKHEKIYKQLIKIFDLIFRFKYTQEMLLTAAQEEYQRKVDKKNNDEMRQMLGDDYDDENSQYGDRNEPVTTVITQETLNHLQLIWKDYKDAFGEFFTLLKDDQLSSKLKFLSFRLDFNEFYTSNPKNFKQKYDKIEQFKVNKSGFNHPKFFPGGLGGFSNNSAADSGVKQTPKDMHKFPLEQQEQLASKLESHANYQKRFMSFNPNDNAKNQKMIPEQPKDDQIGYGHEQDDDDYDDDDDDEQIIRPPEEQKRDFSNITPVPHDQTTNQSRSELLNDLRQFEKSTISQNTSLNVGNTSTSKLLSMQDYPRIPGKQQISTTQPSGGSSSLLGMKPYQMQEDPPSSVKPEFPRGAYNYQTGIGQDRRYSNTQQQQVQDEEEEEEEDYDYEHHGQGGNDYEDDDDDDYDDGQN